MFSQKTFEHRTVQKKEIQILLDSAHNQQKKVNIQESYLYAQKALAKSKNINDSYGIAYSNFYMGQALYELGYYNKALKRLLLAEKQEYSATDTQIMAEINNTTAKIYSILNLPDHALQANYESLMYISKTTNTINKKILQIKVYTDLAANYCDKMVIDSAQKYILKNQEIINLNEFSIPPQQLTDFFALKGYYYFFKKKHDSSAYCFKKSLSVAKKYKYRGVGVTFLVWGMTETLRKKPDSALFYYMKALKNFQELNYKSLIPRTYYLISNTYNTLGNVQKANEFQAKEFPLQKQIAKEYFEVNNTAFGNLLHEQENKTNIKIKKQITILVVFSILFIIISTYFILRKQRIVKKKIDSQEELIAQNKEKNYLLELKVNEAFDDLIQLAKENNPEFITRFRETYPTFISNLIKINPKMQIGDLTFCAYLYLNFSSKDIAQYTFVTPRAVQIRKNRLRKKLNINSEEDIYLWIKNII
ncbi:hypothetical protein SRABI04_01822 [Chryseobacterium sp. Bi04]|nr:hypothetical protein SRABI04_01822 [Chryseobacterium sp. Bi04]